MIRDRVTELRRVRAGDLLPNPANWRRHPQAQQDALRGILAQVGYADALLARETPNGLMLIDGHLRAETTPDQEVPVLVVDVTEEEAALLLATLDPLAGMAVADPVKLAALMDGLKVDSEALRAMLTAAIPLPVTPPAEFAEYDEAIPTEHTCPKCGYAWSGGE